MYIDLLIYKTIKYKTINNYLVTKEDTVTVLITFMTNYL